MATTKMKAQQFIKEMEQAAYTAKTKFGIETQDIDMVIRVDIQDKVTYNMHEDED